MSSDPKKSISTDTLPPLVYAAVIGFVAWMVIAAWGFAGPGYADFSLAVVTGLLIVVIAIPLTLWLVWRVSNDEPPEDRMSFGQWRST